MRQSHDSYADPDDMFSDTRMSFGEHLEDLRIHLIRALVGFVLGMIFSVIFLGKPVLEMIAAPVQNELFKFQIRNLKNRQEMLKQAAAAVNEAGMAPLEFPWQIDVRPLLGTLREELKLPKPDTPSPEPVWVEVPVRIGDPEAYIRALQQLQPYITPPTLNSFNITETIIVYFKVALLCGLVLTSPWVFYQVWAFIAAGLYPHEKRLVHVYMPFSVALFLTGAVICQFFVIPKAIEALLWFNEWLGIGAELRLSDWLGFAIMMPVVFGLSFQTPLVMMFLNKVGIIDVEVFRSHRRIAWFLLAVFAAVITPSVDAISMLFLWVPMGLLYELGIYLCEWQQRRHPRDRDDAPHGEELVEV